MGVMYKLCHIYKESCISDLISLLEYENSYFLNYILKKDRPSVKVNKRIDFETIKKSFP